jgi:hypothetical protein
MIELLGYFAKQSEGVVTDFITILDQTSNHKAVLNLCPSRQERPSIATTMEPSPSTLVQNESETKMMQAAGKTHITMPHTFFYAGLTLLFLISAQKNTYIDYNDLAKFLSNIPQVADGWPTLRDVLGTKPAVYSTIEKQVKAGLSSISKAVSDLLCDWNGGTGLHESTVSLLCYGSEVPVGKVLTEGLKKHGFVLTAGSERGGHFMMRHLFVCKTQSLTNWFVSGILLSVPGVTEQTLISSKHSPPRDYKRIELND